MRMGRYIVHNGRYVHESDLNKVNTRVTMSCIAIVLVMVCYWMAQFMV